MSSVDRRCTENRSLGEFVDGVRSEDRQFNVEAGTRLVSNSSRQIEAEALLISLCHSTGEVSESAQKPVCLTLHTVNTNTTSLFIKHIELQTGISVSTAE